MSEQDAGAAAAATEVTNTPATMEDTMAAVFDKMEGANGASRDDTTGRFKGDGQTQDTAAGAKTGDADTTSSDTGNTKAGEAAQRPIELPKSWSDEEKAVIAALPPDAQKKVIETIGRRESERDKHFNTKSEELANERKRFEGFSSVLAPIEAEAKKYGMSADIAVKQMFERHVDLQRRGPEALKDLAKLYGIKLDGLSPGGESNDGQTADPKIAALESTVATLTRKLESYEGRQTTEQRAKIEGEMDSVAQEKGPDGKPLRPHFEALYEDMAPIAAQLKAKNPSWSLKQLFTEAYDRAANANPEIRAKLQAEAQAKAKAEEERKAKEAANAARKARDNNTRSRGSHGAAGTSKGKDFVDTMSRVYDEMSAA